MSRTTSKPVRAAVVRVGHVRGRQLAHPAAAPGGAILRSRSRFSSSTATIEIELVEVRRRDLPGDAGELDAAPARRRRRPLVRRLAGMPAAGARAVDLDLARPAPPRRRGAASRPRRSASGRCCRNTRTAPRITLSATTRARGSAAVRSWIALVSSVLWCSSCSLVMKSWSALACW